MEMPPSELRVAPVRAARSRQHPLILLRRMAQEETVTRTLRRNGFREKSAVTMPMLGLKSRGLTRMRRDSRVQSLRWGMGWRESLASRSRIAHIFHAHWIPCVHRCGKRSVRGGVWPPLAATAWCPPRVFSQTLVNAICFRQLSHSGPETNFLWLPADQIGPDRFAVLLQRGIPGFTLQE